MTPTTRKVKEREHSTAYTDNPAPAGNTAHSTDSTRDQRPAKPPWAGARRPAPPAAMGDALPETPREILAKAGKRALGGGVSGAAAMGLQVGGLMWLRTTMNCA